MPPPEVRQYVPDYHGHCVVCGATPTVLRTNANGKVVDFTGMCGSCTWDDSELLDPANW
jgi:hypothetical protein